MKISDILKSGIERLGKRKNAVLDCEVILANVLGVEREYLIGHCEEEVHDDLIKLFEAYLRRIQTGEPIAYITQEKEFFGLNFYVDRRVLVPRPETEMLVERVLNYIGMNEAEGKTFRILDVGTGSGCIAISIAKSLTDQKAEVLDQVLALDISEDALDVARINVEQHSMEDRVQLYQSDLLEVVDIGEDYDVIVANLPYIGEMTNAEVEENVKKHEPNRALFAGSSGLSLYKKMFQELKDKDIKFKFLVGEIGDGQRKELGALLSKYFDQKWVVEKDLAGKDRIFVVEN